MKILQQLISNSNDIKIVFQAFETNGILTDKGRRILVQKLIDKKKAESLEYFKGEPLNDWKYVCKFVAMINFPFLYFV